MGRIYGKVSPRLLIALGIVFVSLGAFDVSQVTLQTTSRAKLRDTMRENLVVNINRKVAADALFMKMAG